MSGLAQLVQAPAQTYEDEVCKPDQSFKASMPQIAELFVDLQVVQTGVECDPACLGWVKDKLQLVSQATTNAGLDTVSKVPATCVVSLCAVV